MIEQRKFHHRDVDVEIVSHANGALTIVKYIECNCDECGSTSGGFSKIVDLNPKEVEEFRLF